MNIVNVFDEIIDENDEDIMDIIIYGIPRQIYYRHDHFHDMSELAFFKRFHLTKPTVLSLLGRLENKLEYLYDTNNSISPMNQILTCLRFYSTNGHLQSIADLAGMHKSSVSRIIVRVSEAIAELARDLIQFPTTREEIMITQNEFFDIAGFPRVVGAVDGTHIKVQSPGHEDGEIFRNRKGYFSVNVQAICNAKLEILNVVARWPGSSHDSTIFSHSRIKAEFDGGRYPNCILLGDSGYQIRKYLMTPILNPTTVAEQLYNEAHIRSRTKIENVFGIWKRRFPVLAYGCRLKLETTLTIIVATAVLHNIARTMGEPEPPPAEGYTHILQQLINNGQIPDIPIVQNDLAGTAYAVRNNLVENYFGQL